MSARITNSPNEDTLIASVDAYIEQNTENFEMYVLRTILSERDFHRRVSTSLCVSSDGTSFVEDFEHPHHNAIYHAVAAVLANPDIADDFIPPIPVIEESLNGLANHGYLLAVDEVRVAADRYARIVAMDLETAKHYATIGFSSWLSKRKFLVVSQNTIGNNRWDASELIGQLAEDVAGVSAISDEDNASLSFTSLFDYEEADIERKSTGLLKVDAALGGGLGRSEHVLVIAPTGSGKTVLACQLGAELASQDDNVLLLTTEQHPSELVPRIVSARCNILFDLISGGMQRGMRRLSEDQILHVNQLRELLTDKLEFKVYRNTKRGFTMQDYIAKSLDDYERQKGRQADAVILDWIGGSIRQEARNNLEMIRLLYQNAADFMAEIARDRNIRTVSFAQTNPKQSHNKAKVDLTMMAECKTMGNNATAVIGISALVEAGEGSDQTYRDLQYLHFSKSRKNVPRPIPVRRNFAFQRFEQR